MKHSNHFAEIIESSLQGFLAQSWQWDATPAFGSLIAVQTGTRIVIGIVNQVQTGSMEPSRHPFPYQKTEEELIKEQPQIFEFLKTTFSCITIGYFEKGHLWYLLAPEPPKIHSFVRPASREESARMLSSEKYLPIIFGASQQIFNVDELLLALLHQQMSIGSFEQKNFERFIATFSLLTGNDYRRLKLFLQRVEPLLTRTHSSLASIKTDIAQ